MRQHHQVLYDRFWKPIKKWISILVKGRNDDDNHFGHPYAIL
jgi:hypothetical protein